MNGLHQHTPVLEDVTLAPQIELVIQIPVDFLGCTVFSQKITQNSLAAHPQDLLRKAGIASTKALSVSGMSTLSLRRKVLSDAGARVHCDWLLDDETIVNELPNVLPYVTQKSGDAKSEKTRGSRKVSTSKGLNERASVSVLRQAGFRSEDSDRLVNLCGVVIACGQRSSSWFLMERLPRAGGRCKDRENLLELATEISLTSFGSSHTLFFPHPRTEAASLF